MHVPEKSDMKIPARSDNVNLTSCFDVIKSELSDVRDRIYEQLLSVGDVERPLTEYIADMSGKMLRPGLVLLSGKSCGNINQQHTELAAIAEMIHTATLLHDDVIDQGRNRRNCPTVNTLWGNESAVLLGDFILSRVFSMCARLELTKLNQILSDTTEKICIGELRQNIQQQNWQLSEEDYLEIIDQKTAALFECCCQLGALAADIGEQQVHALSAFGRYLGMAFQIADDLFDLTADKNDSAKTIGVDLAQRKPTLPIIHFCNTIESSKREAAIEKILNCNSPKQLQEMLKNTGSIEYTCDKANDFCQKAVCSLTNLPDNPAKQALINIAEVIATK